MKNAAKKIWRRIRIAGPIRHAQPALGWGFFKLQRKFGSRSLNVDIDTKMGLGAIIAYAIRVHAYADAEGLSANVVSSSPLYSDIKNRDFFQDFFERPAPKHEKFVSGLARKWLLHFGISQETSIEDASAIYNREFIPNDYLLSNLGQEIDKCRRYDVAIHYRGTDKVIESGIVPFTKMIEQISCVLPEGGLRREVFLATDDAQFAKEVRRKFKHVNFYSYDLGDVPNGTPRHFSDLSGADKALEALVNAYLIARAKVCIRTSSYLSALSMIINPQLETRTINWTLTDDLPFPERQIFAQEKERAA